MRLGKLLILEQEGRRQQTTEGDESRNGDSLTRPERHRSERDPSTSQQLRYREAATPLRMTVTHNGLVVLVAGTFPRDQLADGRAGARDRLLVGLDLGSRSFFADGADAESNLLFFRAHFDDFEIV